MCVLALRLCWALKTRMAEPKQLGHSHKQKCWTNGTRTHNDRTKTCSVTITPWSNTTFRGAKIAFFNVTAKCLACFLALASAPCPVVAVGLCLRIMCRPASVCNKNIYKLGSKYSRFRHRSPSRGRKRWFLLRFAKVCVLNGYGLYARFPCTKTA